MIATKLKTQYTTIFQYINRLKNENQSKLNKTPVKVLPRTLHRYDLRCFVVRKARSEGDPEPYISRVKITLELFLK